MKILNPLAIFTFLFCLNTFALTHTEEAKAIFLNYQKLEEQKDETEFGKWFRDMAGLTAMECFAKCFSTEDKKDNLKKSLQALGLPKDQVNGFLSKNFSTGGTFASYSKGEIKRLCPTIASEGFKPYCQPNASSLFNQNKDKFKYNYPKDYVVLKSGIASEITFTLDCSVTFKETKGENSITMESYPNQFVVLKAQDVEKIESSGITNWSIKNNNIMITPQTLPKDFKSTSPLNLPNNQSAVDIKTENLLLKVKSIPNDLFWTLIIEP